MNTGSKLYCQRLKLSYKYQGRRNWGGWRGYSPPKVSRFKYIALCLDPPTFAGSSAIAPPTFSTFRRACYGEIRSKIENDAFCFYYYYYSWKAIPMTDFDYYYYGEIGSKIENDAFRFYYHSWKAIP